MAYRDSLFKSIFGNEASALALYNALRGTNLSLSDTKVVMNTLEETLWTTRRNDLSFSLNDNLIVMAEHQSTINENLPYRSLQHTCRLLEKELKDKKAIYRKSLVMFPRPEYIGLFNGTTRFPNRKRMRLSDAFREGTGKGLGGFGLELVVTIYNVNYGHNRAIMESCPELNGYAYFVWKARLHEAEGRKSGMRREEATVHAIRRAIKDCMAAGHLVDFWENLNMEEINMLVAEWNMETALEVREEEGLERGIEIGVSQGIKRGVERTARNALEEGASPEFVRKITGLDMESIARLMEAIKPKGGLIVAT